MRAFGWSGDRFRCVLRCTLLAAYLLFALPPTSAFAAARQDALSDAVDTVVESFGHGPPVRAQSVPASMDQAAELLGERPELAARADERYIVLIEGSFRFERERGPFLVFLCWRDGDTWSSAYFTVLRTPPPLDSVAPPQEIRLSWRARHPSASHALEGALAVAVWATPPLALLVAAGLCFWRWWARWVYGLGAALALAVAAFQAWVTINSIRAAPSGDWVFHGLKLGMLAVAILIAAAAVVVLLHAARTVARVPTPAERTGWTSAGVALLVLAAGVYSATLPLLGTTGQ